MDAVREAKLMVTTGEAPFRFLSITFNPAAKTGMSTWSSGSNVDIFWPTDEDLRTIIEACESGLGNDK